MNQLKSLKQLTKLAYRAKPTRALINSNLLKSYTTSTSPDAQTSNNFNTTVNPSEIEKFKKMSDSWWDSRGPFEMLHLMNPSRIEFVLNQTILHTKNNKQVFKGLKVLDVGCGGGLVSEALARLGAEVTGIDAGEDNIKIAKLHQQKDPKINQESGLLNYRAITSDQLLSEGGSSQYDIVCSFEVIEHVDNPSHFMKSLVELVKPGGQLFMSTINRSPMAFLQTIVIAEYLLNFVPKGTHDFSKYLTPDELKALVKANNLEFGEINDIVYNPLTHSFSLQSAIPLYPIDYIPIIGKQLTAPMNYIIQAKKPLV